MGQGAIGRREISILQITEGVRHRFQESIGFTPYCAESWAYNALHTRQNCLDTYIADYGFLSLSLAITPEPIPMKRDSYVRACNVMRVNAERGSNSAPGAHGETPVLSQPLKGANQKYTRCTTRFIFNKRIHFCQGYAVWPSIVIAGNLQVYNSNRDGD